MEEPELFIEQITINEVRHLKDVEIPISATERKHLILTGKNGSGKTSVLEEVTNKLQILIANTRLAKESGNFGRSTAKNIRLQFNSIFTNKKLLENFSSGNFIFAFFPARRNLKLNIPLGIKKFEVKKVYGINESIAINFLQHLVNLKADRSFARDDNDMQFILKIDLWFQRFEDTLKFLFDDFVLELVFDRKDYNFNIVLENGQTMPFNALSDGYSAILNIVMELMLRMEGKVKNVYDIQGIVLIDEVETHLHIDLQKKILPFLTSFFPKIQFIVSTHSPFVISSLSNAVVYDLENHTRFEDLSEYPIDGIVEGYFDNDKYSAILTKKIEEYEALTEKDILTKQEEKKRYELFKDLSDVSGKLAPELKMKFQQIQLKRLAKANG